MTKHYRFFICARLFLPQGTALQKIIYQRQCPLSSWNREPFFFLSLTVAPCTNNPAIFIPNHQHQTDVPDDALTWDESVFVQEHVPIVLGNFQV
ncbi:hypothetical protein [Saezia sanguinis]|uniref:hypothetical protein n=1 Tax=Saezia sanguinis TaxID=1965230 RepID=UPI000F8C6C43|nr:hypothetical protein [Saezia sanguinis]